MSASIHIIPANEIDAIKWDKCVANNTNGLIYSTYKYLSFMADNWHGIVIDDYAAVMALPWRKKWGIKYIYTPPFMQQSGLIGTTYNKEVITALNKFSPYITYNFNYDNKPLLKELSYSEHTNLILSLSSSIDVLEKNYSKSLHLNLQKAKKRGITIINGDYLEGLDLFQLYQRNKMNHVSDNDFLMLKKLLSNLQEKDGLVCKYAINNKGKVVATTICLKDQKRIYNLLSSSSKEGKELSAMHLLLHSIINEYADTGIIFDFEGSDIKGVKDFYEKYKCINQPYYRIHQNNLPFLLRMIKK